jgi:hypothetical protein
MLALAQFAVRLICGMCLVLSAMPRATVASGFFRVQMLIVLGLGVLATLAGQTAPINSDIAGWVPLVHWGLSICLAGLGFIASVFWTLERRRGAVWLLYGLTFVSLIALVLGNFLTPASQYHSHWSIVLASDLSSALTLGSAMCGMLLGHSYLTSPTMSISPLSRLNHFLGWAGIVRGFISGVVLALAWSHLRGEGVFWTWLTLRWIAGVFGPLMVWQMVWRILVFRNTQAATGVLFVGVILTLLGELTGTLLLTSTGYPL